MLPRLLLVVLIAVGCSDSKESTLKKLQGHWHSVDFHFSMTMEISDSTVIIDRYLLQYQERNLPLFDSLNSIVLPVPCGCGDAILPAMDKFFFKGDTLIYDNDAILDDCQTFKPLKFYKSDLTVCKWSHYSYSDKLTMSLPVSNANARDFDSLRDNSKVALIFVGYPKNPEWGIDPKIQVQDVFISIRDIPIFVSKSQYPNDTMEFLSVILAMDSSVKKTFADSVVSAIPKSDSIKFFRLVKLRGSNELGYERMN